MPGPVSDNYDPEFGTGANAAIVAEAMTEVRDAISLELGRELHDIIAVCKVKCRRLRKIRFTERELRIIRFSINRALESM